MKKIVISVAVVVAIVLVAAFVPLVEAEFGHTETYLEDEPVIETYYETVSLEYAVTAEVRGGESIGFPPGMYLVVVAITNTDNVSGNFSLNWLCLVPTGIGIPREGLPYSPGQPQMLRPGETMHRNRTNNVPEVGDYSIDTSTKTVERDRIVGTETVEKERLVTHYERAPVFEYLRSRFQD